MKIWRCDLENRWCAQNLDGVKQLFKSVINILMVWTNLCKCDPENRWCDQNLDGVKQLFKSVINILMVWSKLWRFENWWCEQNLDGVNKIFKSVINIVMVWTKLWRCDPENWWCDQNLDGVKQIFKSVNNIFMVWSKLWRCDLENWWCDQNFYGVIKCWWCDETIFRCEQTSIFWKLCDHTVWCDLYTCFFLMLPCFALLIVLILLVSFGVFVVSDFFSVFVLFSFCVTLEFPVFRVCLVVYPLRSRTRPDWWFRIGWFLGLFDLCWPSSLGYFPCYFPVCGIALSSYSGGWDQSLVLP